MSRTRTIQWTPAYDKRHTDPKKNYGIHGVTMRWILQGPEGAIQFVVYTNWQLPHVREEHDHRPIDDRFPHLLCRPTPADIGYHSPKPCYEGQTAMGRCDVLPEGDCYYDGSSLNTEKGFNLLVEEGDEAVWKWMGEYYDDRLVGGDE